MNKHRFSAFLPNSSDLDAQLRERDDRYADHHGYDHQCLLRKYSSRCAMLGYKVVFVSDATAAFTDEEHNATLLSMATVFAEVRDTAGVLELLGAPAFGAPLPGLDYSSGTGPPSDSVTGISPQTSFPPLRSDNVPANRR